LAELWQVLAMVRCVADALVSDQDRTSQRVIVGIPPGGYTDADCLRAYFHIWQHNIGLTQMCRFSDGRTAVRPYKGAVLRKS